MKLQKALKLRKKLIGEIAQLKVQIQEKNSYTVGSLDAEKYNVSTIYALLQTRINELVGLKYAINEANREIQPKIYILSETKALIAFWKEVSVKEGKHQVGFSEVADREYKAQIDEQTRNKFIEEFQTKVDTLQEEIDTYNYTTEIPWGEEPKA